MLNIGNAAAYVGGTTSRPLPMATGPYPNGSFP